VAGGRLGARGGVDAIMDREDDVPRAVAAQCPCVLRHDPRRVGDDLHPG
jgi:hypothetical protein